MGRGEVVLGVSFDWDELRWRLDGNVVAGCNGGCRELLRREQRGGRGLFAGEEGTNFGCQTNPLTPFASAVFSRMPFNGLVPHRFAWEHEKP